VRQNISQPLHFVLLLSPGFMMSAGLATQHYFFEPIKMKTLLLLEKPLFYAQAFFVGSRLDLRTLEKPDVLASNPLTVRTENGCAVLYRYGVIIFFSTEPLIEKNALELFKAHVIEPFENPEAEEITVSVDPTQREGVRGNTVYISELTIEHLQIIADVLSKSVVLAEYEGKIAHNFDLIEPLAKDLERNGKVSVSAKELLQNIGAMLLSEHLIVGRVHITEKPEILWENPLLQGFYGRLEDEFEILERHATMERKLNLVSRTVETLLEVLNTRSSYRLEWLIVILIAVEIVLSVYSIFLS